MSCSSVAERSFRVARGSNPRRTYCGEATYPQKNIIRLLYLNVQTAIGSCLGKEAGFFLLPFFVIKNDLVTRGSVPHPARGLFEAPSAPLDPSSRERRARNGLPAWGRGNK